MEGHEKPIYRGGGGLGSLQRAFDEKEEVVFLMGVDTPMHIMYVEN